jgi:hypothetical protein
MVSVDSIRRGGVHAVAVVGLTLTFGAPAGAQSSSDSATAQALFDEARSLMSAGHPAEACPKLEESQRLDPGSGTLLNLAHCYEQAGRLTSAWTKYLDAAAAAKQSGNAAREGEARQQAATLRPRLSSLAITVSAEAKAIAGLEVTRDGEVVGAPQWGLAIPADEGDHPVTAKAPGFAPWQSVAVVKGEAATVSITVPALIRAPAASAVAPLATKPGANEARPSGSDGLGTQRIVAIVAGGVGVVGIALGTVFGLKSKSKHDEAATYCSGASCTDPAGVTAGNDAHAAGNVATVGMVVGVVGLAAGVTLWFTAPGKGESSPAQVGFGLGTVRLKGAF